MIAEQQNYISITPFFPEATSFRGSFIYDQVRAIQKTQRYQNVIVFKPVSFLDHRASYIYQDIKVYLFKYIQMPSLFFNGLTNDINAQLFLDAFHKAGFSADEVSVAHAHTSVFASCALALKKNNKQIITLLQHHDGDPFTIRNGKFASWSFNATYRAKKNIRLFNQIDCHVSISKFVERHLTEFPMINEADYYESYKNSLRLVQHLPSISPRQSLILYNGVDCTKFPSVQRPTKNEHLIVGCIANFVELKDQITLIKSIQRLINQPHASPIYLKLIGSGPTLEECKTYVQTYGLEQFVTFEKELPHDQLAQFYHSLDLFVLPSFFEGFGCVCLEAYACGVPFMICHGQGASEYIPPEDGDKWLFHPGNDDELSGLISRFSQERYTQYLCHEHDINLLIGNFLTQIDQQRQNQSSPN